MPEFYVENGDLISRGSWESKIASWKSSVAEDLKDHDKAKKVIGQALVDSILERVPEDEKFGVMFSGGVDSSFIAMIAKRTGRDFICYTVGFKDEGTKAPEDSQAAEEGARLLGLALQSKIFTLSESEQLIKKTVQALGPQLANVVNVGVGSVVMGCIDLAKKDNVRYLFSGLGSEELFAGYERHRKAKDRQDECWNGLAGMYRRDLLRDASIAKATGMTFLTPFLDEDVIAQAMRAPAGFKIDGEDSKIILREIAEGEGLPRQIAWRKKRAAQYGSRLDRAIDKLAGKKGFQFKKDYLASLN
jgi:diphthine-ammonia ligase